MKKNITWILALLLITGFSACIKDSSCKPKTVASEEAEMQNYATSISMAATRHSTGVYYQILNQGSGPAPTFSSVLSVRYTGKLLNGTIFDSQTTNPVSFPLGQVILGWQVGLSLIQKGGVIRLIIPSSLAYGCQGRGSIPADAILYFDVELVDVQ